MTRSSRSSSPSRSRRHESHRSRETSKKDFKQRSRSREGRDRTDRGRNRSIDREERLRSRSTDKRDRYRSLSKDRSERRRNRSEDRSDKRRSRSHDHRSRKRDISEKGSGKSKEILEDEAALQVAAEIKKTAAAEVEAYLQSEDFRVMVDSMKRRERERIMREVDEEMAVEKEILLNEERRRIKAENDKNFLSNQAAEEIVLQNKMVMEAQQRKDFEARLVADSQRLQAIQLKTNQDREEEVVLAASIAREKEEKDLILLRHKKLSFSFGKKG